MVLVTLPNGFGNVTKWLLVALPNASILFSCVLRDFTLHAHSSADNTGRVSIFMHGGRHWGSEAGSRHRASVRA